jgi:hypothetical protein
VRGVRCGHGGGGSGTCGGDAVARVEKEVEQGWGRSHRSGRGAAEQRLRRRHVLRECGCGRLGLASWEPGSGGVLPGWSGWDCYRAKYFSIPTQNISSYTYHIKSFDACMEH